MEINGLELPDALTKALECGTWKMPANHALIQNIFPLEHLVQPVLYDKDSLKLENANWPKERNPSFLGAKGGRELPGDIDPSKSVIIGDLGPDLPIALDYRASPERPSVVYLFQDGPWSVRWATAAPNVESLATALGLTQSTNS